MLIVNATSLKLAYSEMLQRLLSESGKHEDPEIYREDVGTLCIRDRAASGRALVRDGNALRDPFSYAEYFPHVTQELVDREMRYWNRQFFGENKLPELIRYLRAFPLSKRGIILFWEDGYRDLSRRAVCEIAAFFRVKDGRLEMHSLMRANNASFLLFMDMRILMGVQRIVAEELGLGLGDYVHFIDSLHVYEAEKEAVVRQSEMVASSVLWREL